ncbi:uncharacterized protein LOC119687541 [Teleopsis dalmanni]|uniref:uncharacterized protein LOC119687541 n=1 Tax=Teleopsis dalmanni TaxID=139649 RepID=UPI0018CD6D28|nr:uncharacterized protein LOC119687541 [Teleopsis dalmanni]
MGKSKESSTSKSHKKSSKSHKSDAPKQFDDISKVSSINRKQTELARVLQIKCDMIVQGNLSYLEYIELRDEIRRLNAMKEIYSRKIISLENL